MESEAGYRVSRALVNGQPVYTAWRPVKSQNPYSRVGYAAMLYTPDLEAARAAFDNTHSNDN